MREAKLDDFFKIPSNPNHSLILWFTALGKSLAHTSIGRKGKSYFASPQTNGLLVCLVFSREGLYSTFHNHAVFSSGFKGNQPLQRSTKKAEKKPKAMTCKGCWDQFKKVKFPKQRGQTQKVQTQAFILVRCCSFHRPGVKGAQHHFPETIRRELHPSLFPWGINRLSILPFPVSLGKYCMLKIRFKNQNVVCLAKGSVSLCKLLDFPLRVNTLLAVLISSNQSLNIDHTTENGKTRKAFLVNIYTVWL